MNKIGIHYGCFVSTWIEEQLGLIKKTAEMGFEVLEIGSSYIIEQNSDKLKKIKETAQANNVQLTLSLGMLPEHDISSADQEKRKAGIKALIQMSAAMAECGITECCGVVYCEWNRTANSIKERNEAWARSAASMKEAITGFENNGVFLNVEPTNRFENSLINCCDQAVEYIDEIGSPNIGIHLDTFHMNIEEDSFIYPIIRAGNKLRYFHIGENNRKIPGTGGLPWKSIFDGLKCAGYCGPIVMEPFVRSGNEIGTTLSLYREIADLSTYDEDLVNSLNFVKSLLR